VNSKVDFHGDEGEEAGVVLKGLVIGANNGHLLFDIGEGDAEEGVERLEHEAELVQDLAELVEADLFLGGVGLDQGLETADDVVDLKFLHVKVVYLNDFNRD
jgi:hypothetical protein